MLLRYVGLPAQTGYSLVLRLSRDARLLSGEARRGDSGISYVWYAAILRSAVRNDGTVGSSLLIDLGPRPLTF